MSDPVEKIKYVLGFAFSPWGLQVVLIEKNRPDWQKGYLNGIGGKIEPGETPLQAMIREFKEEAGLRIENWDHTVTIEGPTWKTEVFRAFNNYVLNAKSMTDEKVNIYPVDHLDDYQVLNNLHWLVRLNLDTEGGIRFPVTVNYDRHTNKKESKGDAPRS